MQLSIKAGATSQSTLVFIQDSTSTTGAGLTGLAYNTSGLTAYYSFAGASAASTSITLATLSTVGSAYSSGGFKELNSTNMPGWYRFDIPNAVIAASSGRMVGIHFQGATNMAPTPVLIELTGWDNQDAVHGGMSALPNTTCTTNASLLTSGTGTDQISVASGLVNVGKINSVSTSSVTTINANQGTTQPLNFTGTAGSALVKSDMTDIAGSAVSATTAQIGVNVVNWNNTVVATPATAGIPDVNVKNMNNVAATSVTTINANQGTTQPVNFTGTAGSALVKSDMTDIAGSAVATGTAQIGVNLVNIAGSAVATGTAQLGVNVVNWGGSAAPAMVNGWIPAVTPIRSGTAQAGGASTITLDAGASATNNLYDNELIYISGGTGAGQVNTVSSYVGSTKVATMIAAWATNPDNTSTFVILPAGPISATVSGGVNVTQWNGSAVAAPNVSGVPLVDVGYFRGTTSAGAAGYAGVDWGHVNAPTTTVGLTNTTISTGQTIATVTNQLTAAAIATGVWQDTTAGDFTTASSIGKSLYTSGVVPGGSGGLFIAGSNAATTVNFTGNLSGSVGSVTGAVGSISGVTFPSGFSSLTTAAIATGIWSDTTSGDFTTVNSPGHIITAQLGQTFTTTGSAIFTVAALANAPTGGSAPTTGQIATAVWTDLLSSSDFSTAASVGALVKANTMTSVSGSVGSVTGNVGGNVNGSVGSISGVTFPTHFSVMAIDGSGDVTFNNASIATVTAVTNPVSVNLAQTLNAARALDTISDTSLTLNDALYCAISVYAGKWDISGTSWVCQTPFSATTLRTFTLDNSSAPTQRS